MEVLYQRCCGVDIHKKSVVACLRTVGTDGRVQQQVRTFGTMTDELLELSDWLVSADCTHVAMESTGSYWQPLYNLLEDTFTLVLVNLVLVNAQHVKRMPGRKTDVKDSEWLAQLLQHGLLVASFVPPRPQRELREVTRYRTALVREHTADVNRIAKTLEGANIKLSSVATDIVGVSGRQMLEALVAGVNDPQVLAELAKGRLRAKLPELRRALSGSFNPHHRLLIAEQLSHLEGLEESIARLSEEITRRLAPDDAAITRLDGIPGVGRPMAEAIIAELGVDLHQFPSAGHLASWAGLCPGNHQSAGKRFTGRTRHGTPYLRALPVQAAHAAARTNTTDLAAQFRRLKGRLGVKKAAVAVAHSILVAIYHLLTRQVPYQDLGATYFDQRQHDVLQQRLIRRLEGLGLKVTVERTSPAA